MGTVPKYEDEPPTTDKVWNSAMRDGIAICPHCGERAFLFIPKDCSETLETVGKIKYCSTEFGMYAHGGIRN